MTFKQWHILVDAHIQSLCSISDKHLLQMFEKKWTPGAAAILIVGAANASLDAVRPKSESSQENKNSAFLP
jgi:hypothetical protein